MMTTTRLLLAIPAALLAVGGAMHLWAFRKAADAAAGSNLPPFFGNSLKALWLMDSCGMFVLATVCAVCLADPQGASPVVIVLLALIPLSTAGLLYAFIGNFFAAHMLLVAGASMAAAAITR